MQSCVQGPLPGGGVIHQEGRGRGLEEGVQPGDGQVSPGAAGGWKTGGHFLWKLLVDTSCGQAVHGVDTGQDWGAEDSFQMELRDGDTIYN